MNALATRDSATDPIGVGVLPLPNPKYLGIEWDAENRLLAINQGTLRSEFSYDGESRRVRIVEKSGQTVTSDRRFLWCMRVICEERSSSGGTVVKRFFPDGVQQGGQAFFYGRDHLGSIRELSDGAAATRARYDYDAYGKRNFVAGDQSSDFGFTGHYEHSPGGMVLTLYRAYDASIGRWLSEDPLGILSGSDGANLYAYVTNGPTNLIDPYGLQTSHGGEMCKPVCKVPLPPVPPLPPGENVNDNMRTCLEQPFNPWWFQKQVTNKGPWDYKQKGSRYEPGGNFNFGATCKAFGFPESICLREAGRRQQTDNTSSPSFGDPGSRFDPIGGTPPYGDDPADQQNIKGGFKYYEEWQMRRLCGCAP